jgi:hypothetical protein
MASQNRQNFQNRLLSKESRQPAPFQRILKDARKPLRVFYAPQGALAMTSRLGDIACFYTIRKESFAGFVGFVTKNNQ